jgi:Ca-activated chloride channel family protein
MISAVTVRAMLIALGVGWMAPLHAQAPLFDPQMRLEGYAREVANGSAAVSPQDEASRIAKEQQSADRSESAGGFRIKSDVNLVLVEATVRNQYGGIVGNLSREDFQLREDGVEQQIRYFSRDELPLAVALVVDRSGSMGPVLKQLHHIAYETLSLLKPDDEVALFDFAARAEELVELTTDRERVAERIQRIPAGGATVIADALFEAASYLNRAAPNRRHAVILVSDNDNTLQGYCDEARVIRRALEAETVVYSIKVEEGLHPQMMNVLLPVFHGISVPEITRQTGGEVIEAPSLKSIESAMQSAISRLRQRYSLGYYSTNHRHEDAFRNIEIRIVDRSPNSIRSYTVYARRGYYPRPGPIAASSSQP